MSNAIANQLFLAYLGRPADVAWRNATGLLLSSGAPSPQLQNAFFAAAVADGAFSLTDSSSQLVNKIFLNVFGFGASTSEQSAWAALIQNGTITTQSAAWTIFSSYLGASNVPDSYKLPAQSKLIAVEAYTAELLNNPTANLALSSGTPTVTQTAKSFISGITSQATAATAILPAAIAATVSGLSNSQTGSSFLLTTGVDSFVGTAGNDTFTADNGSGPNKVTSPADTIAGGSGTDTLKIYEDGGVTATTLPSLSSIEVIYLNNDAAGLDVSGVSGLTSLIIDAPKQNATQTFTTSGGPAITIQNSAGTGGASIQNIDDSTATAFNITVSNVGKTTAETIAIGSAATKSAKVATVNFTATGADNTVTLQNLGGAVATINIVGDKGLTLTEGLGTVKTINASAATGAVSVDASNVAALPSSFAFTGGAGNDTIKLAAGVLGVTTGITLDGGAGATDKISVLDTNGAGTSLAAAVYKGLNAALNFEVIGLAGTGATTIDASQIAGYKIFSVDVDQTHIINNVATGSTVNVTAAHLSALTVTSAVGVSDLSLNIGTAKTAGFNVGAVGTNALTFTGLNKIALVSNGDGTKANKIDNLANADNSSFTITGSNDLTITATNVSGAGGTGSKYDASGFTGKLNITSSATPGYQAGSSAGDVIIGGSGVDTIKAGKNSGTFTGGAGADSFDVSVALANAGGVANTTIAGSVATTTTITDFSKGDKLVFTGLTPAFTAAKVDLSSFANLSLALDELARVCLS